MGNIRDSKITQDKIIKASIKLFAKDGFDGVSVDSIANDAGVNKAMIYYYFKNKANLYKVVINVVLEEIYVNIVEQNGKYKDPAKKLSSFIDTFARYANANPHLSSLMLLELGSGGKSLPKDVFMGLKKIFSLHDKILKEGEDVGVFSKTKPMLIHFMIIGAINLFITTKELREVVSKDMEADVCDNCHIDDVAKYLQKSILKAIKKEDG